MPSYYDECSCGKQKDHRAERCRDCRDGEVGETKRCSSCQEVKPVSAFRWRKRKKARPRPECRACESGRTLSRPEALLTAKLRWQARNPEKVKLQAIRTRLRRAGVPEAEVQKAMARCADAARCDVCCRTPDEVGRLRVDHCHTTLVFRGLLCDSCNLGLGKFADDPRRLRAAARYLTRPAQRSSRSRSA